jgi:hypothetical protein
MNIPDLNENLVSVFWVSKFFDSGSCQPWIRDGKNRIRDKRPGSATLVLKEQKLH